MLSGPGRKATTRLVTWCAWNVGKAMTRTTLCSATVHRGSYHIVLISQLLLGFRTDLILHAGKLCWACMQY